MKTESDPASKHVVDGSFLHAHALVESTRIGRGSSIHAFTHVLPGAAIGCDALVLDHVFIGNDVVVGDRVTIMCGVHLWDGLRVEDDVVIGPNATFSSAPVLRGETQAGSSPGITLKRGANIGANSTILPGLTVGAHAVVSAGAVVTRDVPPNAIVAGNPARITGYVNTGNVVPGATGAKVPPDISKPLPRLRVANATLRRIPRIADLRGVLTFAEIGAHLPFEPKRFFAIYDVPGLEVRGEHAHKELHQFLICLKGSCAVVLDDGRERDEVVLATPEIGLHIPPMVWGIQYLYTPDALMLVLASDVYRASDYIRDYEEFVGMVVN